MPLTIIFQCFDSLINMLANQMFVFFTMRRHTFTLFFFECARQVMDKRNEAKQRRDDHYRTKSLKHRLLTLIPVEMNVHLELVTFFRAAQRKKVKNNLLIKGNNKHHVRIRTTINTELFMMFCKHTNMIDTFTSVKTMKKIMNNLSPVNSNYKTLFWSLYFWATRYNRILLKFFGRIKRYT